jgi:hypothetical protein
MCYTSPHEGMLQLRSHCDDPKDYTDMETAARPKDGIISELDQG